MKLTLLLIVLSTLSIQIFDFSSQVEHCQVAGDDCGDDIEDESDGESIMLKASTETKNDTNDNTSENDVDELVEVEGDLEPCDKTEAAGQLQKSLLQQTGYVLEK